MKNQRREQVILDPRPWWGTSGYEPPMSRGQQQIVYTLAIARRCGWRYEEDVTEKESDV